MTINPPRRTEVSEEQQDQYWLSPGAHRTPEDGRCAMEWISHLTGEDHTDKPTSVSPTLRSLLIQLNDGLSDELRQRLRPYLARAIGTADDGLEHIRNLIHERIMHESPHPIGTNLGMPGFMDSLAMRYLKPGGYLDQLMPLVPWSSADLAAEHAAAFQRRQEQARHYHELIGANLATQLYDYKPLTIPVSASAIALLQEADEADEPADIPF